MRFNVYLHDLNSVFGQFYYRMFEYINLGNAIQEKDGQNMYISYIYLI